MKTTVLVDSDCSSSGNYKEQFLVDEIPKRVKPIVFGVHFLWVLLFFIVIPVSVLA